MATIANLEARYSANVIDFERELKRLQSINKRATDRVLADHKASARATNQAWAKADIGGAINRSMGSGLGALRSQLMASIGAIVAGAGTAAAIGLADTYTRFQNSLKVAGLEGQQLAVVQGRLFEIANRNGIAVEGLGQLYGRLSMATKQLGASQGDLEAATNSVASAIRISGRPASEASGAMTQLSQAFAGGKVRAEEWSSVIEGMPALAMALANASEKYRGNLGALKADVDKGNFSSAEMLRLMKLAEPALRKQAELAGTTTAQGFEVLKNKMVEFIGKTNETWGITARLSEALVYLSENLDDVARVLGLLAIAMGATLAPAIGKAVLAVGAYAASTGGAIAGSIALQTRLGMMSGASLLTAGSVGTLTVAMRALMSATGIGLAIVAITTAVGFFAAQNYKAEEATRQLRDRLKEKTAALDEAEKAAKTARIETGDMTTTEYAALEATAKLTGRVDLLTSAYGRMALAAWEAARAAAAAALEAAATDRKKATADRQRAEAQSTRRNTAPGTYGSGDGRQAAPLGYQNVVRGAVAVDPRVMEAQAAERSAMRVEEAERANAAKVYRDGINGTVEGYGPPRTTSAPTGGPTGSRSGSGGSSGPSAEDIADNGNEALAQANRQLRDAVRGQAVTNAERHAVSIQALEDDKAMAVLAIEKRVKDGEITRAIGDQLISIQAQTTSAQIATETARRAEELRAAEAEMVQLRTNNQAEALRLDADELAEQARGTTDMETRHAYEREALAKSQEADRLIFEAEMETLRLEKEKAGWTQQQINDMIAARRENFNRGQAGQTTAQTNDQNTQRGPQSIGAWAAAFRDATNEGESFNQKMFSIAEGGINSLTDGITDAIMGAKSLGEAFADMAKQMIAQLVKLMVQWAIWEAIGLATGNGPGWGLKVIGLGSNTKPSSAPAVKKNAMGTNFWHGGPTSINEKGEEIITLPSGSTVIPHNMVKAMKMGAKVQNGGQTIVNQITVDATDAVLGQTVKGWIHEAVGQGMAATKAMIAQDQQKAGRNRLM